MPRLEQTIRILTLDTAPGYGGNPDAVYSTADEDTLELTTMLVIDADDYVELGEPDTITVTIRPGDHLNPEDVTE
jgi:hypothetical protein